MKTLVSSELLGGAGCTGGAPFYLHALVVKHLCRTKKVHRGHMVHLFNHTLTPRFVVVKGL